MIPRHVNKSLRLICAASAIALVQGCATNPMDQERALELVRAMSNPRPAVPAHGYVMGVSQSPDQKVVEVSEQSLGERIAGWTSTSGPVMVEGFRDGFSIGGKRVLDPEGPIYRYAVDSKTGNAAYLVQTQPQQFVLKLLHHASGEVVQLGTASRQAGGWSVQTVTGVKANGARLNVTPRGFIVSRDRALFRYTAGVGLKSFALPDTHTMAAHQNGSVHQTGWLLLEVDPESKKPSGGSSFFGQVLAQSGLADVATAARRVGLAAGVGKADSDYVLYHYESGRTVPIGIELGDKQTTLLSECRRKNAALSLCDRAESVESLYSQDGSPNNSHYFWRVSWFDTNVGTVAVVMEDNVSKVDALNLDSGQRVNVFQRALGIASWSAKQQPDGKVQVRAQLGFESQLQGDVAGLFRTGVQTGSAALSSVAPAARIGAQ